MNGCPREKLPSHYALPLPMQTWRHSGVQLVEISIYNAQICSKLVTAKLACRRHSSFRGRYLIVPQPSKILPPSLCKTKNTSHYGPDKFSETSKDNQRLKPHVCVIDLNRLHISLAQYPGFIKPPAVITRLLEFIWLNVARSRCYLSTWSIRISFA